MRKVSTLLNVALLAAIAFAGYYLIKSHVEADLYHEKLVALSQDYEKLKTNYNQAVKKTAVTELLVNEDGSICVVFVSMNGEEKVVPTKFRMGSEIFVDFVIIDGRAFFRRVFDENTAPKEAMLIDPKLQEVEWDKGHASSGKATYAKLTEQGRWVVTLTGNGSLDIRKKGDNEPQTVLVPSVDVNDYSQVEKDVKDTVNKISFGDVMGRLFGSGQEPVQIESKIKPVKDRLD